MTGEKFIKSLIRPVPPVSLLSLIQAGWPIDSVFTLGVRSVNGLHATSRTALVRHDSDAEFSRLLRLLRELQASDSFGLRVEEREGAAAGIVIFRSGLIHDDLLAKSREVRRILRLSPDATEFKIVFGSTPKDGTGIAFQTRSVIEILSEVAMGVDIPTSDLDEGRAVKVPVLAPAADPGSTFLMHVRSSPNKPPAGDAFTAVHCRDHWFWVADRDSSSKRGLGFLLVLFNLAESGTTAVPPVLTISKPLALPWAKSNGWLSRFQYSS
jgi:hypothetical protein